MRTKRIALMLGALCLALLPCLLMVGCATPKSGTVLDEKRVDADGAANSSQVDSDKAQNSGSTPNATTRVVGSDGKPRIIGASPGPVDAFGLDALNMTLALSNTVTMKKGEFDFAVSEKDDGTQEATIRSVKFDEFSTAPPATIEALAGFQQAWNPAKIAEVQATKEAWNKTVEELALTVRETLPELATQILKTFVVP